MAAANVDATALYAQVQSLASLIGPLTTTGTAPPQYDFAQLRILVCEIANYTGEMINGSAATGGISLAQIRAAVDTLPTQVTDIQADLLETRNRITKAETTLDPIIAEVGKKLIELQTQSDRIKMRQTPKLARLLASQLSKKPMCKL